MKRILISGCIGRPMFMQIEMEEKWKDGDLFKPLK